jgi:hypothetical protein
MFFPFYFVYIYDCGVYPWHALSIVHKTFPIIVESDVLGGMLAHRGCQGVGIVVSALSFQGELVSREYIMRLVSTFRHPHTPSPSSGDCVRSGPIFGGRGSLSLAVIPIHFQFGIFGLVI